MYYFLNEGNLYRNPIYSRGESEGRNYSLYSLFYDILQIPSSLAETIFHTIYFKKWQKKIYEICAENPRDFWRIFCCRFEMRNGSTGRRRRRSGSWSTSRSRTRTTLAISSTCSTTLTLGKLYIFVIKKVLRKRAAYTLNFSCLLLLFCIDLPWYWNLIFMNISDDFVKHGLTNRSTSPPLPTTR